MTCRLNLFGPQIDSRTLADYVYKNIVRKNNMRFQQMKTVMLASDNKKTRQKMSQGLFKWQRRSVQRRRGASRSDLHHSMLATHLQKAAAPILLPSRQSPGNQNLVPCQAGRGAASWGCKSIPWTWWRSCGYICAPLCCGGGTHACNNHKWVQNRHFAILPQMHNLLHHCSCYLWGSCTPSCLQNSIRGQ